MDLATIIGIVLGFGLIIGTIVMGGSINAFINIPGLTIVVGGTIAATLIMQRLGVVLGAIKVGIGVFFNRYRAPEELIQVIVRLANIARKEGMLFLDKEVIDDPFLSKGIRLLVDGISEKDVVSILRTELMYLKQRHKRGQKIFKFMTATAPAMGMVGTLIGLVQMLMDLNDPSMIGPAMAVALLTTFYGAVIAFLITGPIASKLENRTAEEAERLELILAGILGIANGDNPRIIEQNLASFLDPKKRDSAVEKAAEEK